MKYNPPPLSIMYLQMNDNMPLTRLNKHLYHFMLDLFGTDYLDEDNNVL